MKKIFKSLINIFKKDNKKGLKFNDIYDDCQSSSNELDEFCKLEGLSK